jgi:RimJ/RimL family protein N-acetyltransferase
VGPLALSALADVAFGPLRLRRLVASIKPDNQASLAAFVKAGFALVSEPHAVTAIRTSGVR